MTAGYRVPVSPVIRPVPGSGLTLITRQGAVTVIPPVPALHGIGRSVGPPAIVPHHRAGYLIPSWLDTFYNRIVVLPASLALGAISTEQRITVKLWNAWLVPQHLLTVTLSGGGGVTLSGPTTPRWFNRLAVHEWQLTVSMEGPDVLDCTVTWQFAGLPPATFYLTGSRTVGWTLTPDWTDGVTETLEWKTDVLQSQTGAGQRIARRLSPRRTFEFSALLGGTGRQRFEQSLFHYGTRTWALPVYPDVAYLSEGALTGSETLPIVVNGRDFHAGGAALICADSDLTATAETVDIAAVEADRLQLTRSLRQSWPAGTLVYPLRSAVLTDPPAITRHSDEVIRARIRFRVTEHNAYSDAHSLPEYRGFPVLEPGSDWTENLSAEYTRLLFELDNGTGIPYRLDTAARPFVVQSHTWQLADRETQSHLRRLFYYLRGRQRPVWVGSQASDLFVADDIGGQIMDIRAMGFSDEGARPGRRDLRIETTQGAHYVRVTDSTPLNADTERLAIDRPLSISRAEIVKISWLSLCRLNSDSVEWLHRTDADGAATVSVTFIGVRDELE